MTRATVIGPITPYAGRLFYDGRRQSKLFYAETEVGLKRQCRERINELKKSLGETYKLVYPDPIFELRIFS